MFLIDTNILGYLLRGNPKVEENFASFSDQIVMCSIVKAECLFGAKKKKSNVYIEQYAGIFENYPMFDFDSVAADYFTNVKVYLSDSGKNVEDFDVMIAAIALANDCTLVTNNLKHFKDIENLKVVDWSK